MPLAGMTICILTFLPIRHLIEARNKYFAKGFFDRPTKKTATVSRISNFSSHPYDHGQQAYKLRERQTG
jgi:hypothetical protein